METPGSALSYLSQQRGSQAPAPAPGTGEGPCSIGPSTAQPRLHSQKKMTSAGERSLVGTISRTSSGRETSKESRIMLFKAMPSCLPNDLDAIKWRHNILQLAGQKPASQASGGVTRKWALRSLVAGPDKDLILSPRLCLRPGRSSCQGPEAPAGGWGGRGAGGQARRDLH